MYDLDMIYTPKDWYWNYSWFHRSSPFQGQKYHQLCVGPFVFEWKT